MKIRRSAFTLIELVAVVIMMGLVLFLMLPSFTRTKLRSHKQRCANRLRAAGFGMLIYANDHKYFPHMQALDAPNLSTDVAKVYRTLIYFKYVDNPEDFICSSSEDFPIALDDAVINNPKQFQWKSAAASGSNQLPILAPPDPDLFADPDFLQLSYTYRRDSLAAEAARSDTIVAADKAIKEELDAYDPVPGTPPPPVGNHRDGFNVFYGDGHVNYVRTSEEALMIQMAKRLHMGPFDPSNISGK